MSNYVRCEAPPFMIDVARGRLIARDEYEQVSLLLGSITSGDGSSLVKRVRAKRLWTDILPHDTMDLYTVSATAEIFDIKFNNLAAPVEKKKPGPAAPTDDVQGRRAVFGDTSSDDGDDADKTPAAQPPSPPDGGDGGHFLRADHEILCLLRVSADDVAGALIAAEAAGEYAEDVDVEDATMDEHPSDAIVPRPFPSPPHVLATILTWCRNPTMFSTPEIFEGLAYLGFRLVGYTVFKGAQRLGSLHCNNGVVLHADCAHASSCLPSAAACSSVMVEQRCRCSLRMPSQTRPELQRTEAALVLWLIAGSCMGVQEHMSLSDVLQAERAAEITARVGLS